MAGHLNPPLTNVLPNRAPEAPRELAGEVHAVDAYRMRKALQCVVPAKLFINLLLHASQPRWRLAPHFEAGPPAQLCKNYEDSILHGGGGQIVTQRKLPVQMKQEPMGRGSTRVAEVAEVGQGIGGALEHARIDGDH